MADKAYKLLFELSDGTTKEVQFTAPQGDIGPAGVGIKSAVLNSDYTLTLTFTDGSGYQTTSLRGAPGTPGKNGADGANGSNGVSPTVEVSKSGKVTTITITDAEGTKTATINDGEDGTGTATIPDYVRTEAETIARIINQHQSNDSIVFPFLADAHTGYYTDTSNDAVKLAGQLLHQIGKRVPYDFIVNGGDIACGAWNTTREDTFKQIEDYTELTHDAHGGVPSIWTPGNHDDSPYMATADRVSQTEVFGLIGRKNRVSGAMCPDGCNYGYLDFENRRLRVIYLDTDDKRSMGSIEVGAGAASAPDYLNAHNIGPAQLQWLADIALDFTDKDDPKAWGIVVISHVALNATWSGADVVSGEAFANSTEHAATLLNAYRNGKSGSIIHNGATVNYDFTGLETRAAVICCVHGHNHAFINEMLGDIVSIGCPNVMNGRERVSADGNTYTKTAGTADGTSFCIITIDRENQRIYADCVGAGYDRQFEYSMEVITYTNQIPISTDASGAVYNGKGYKENTYLSGGSEGARDGIYATGYIPCIPGDILYFKNVGLMAGQSNHRISTFKAGKVYSEYIFNTTSNSGTSTWITYGDDGNVEKISIPTGTSFTGVEYIRLCCSYIGDDSIITVNEPIE